MKEVGTCIQNIPHINTSTRSHPSEKENRARYMYRSKNCKCIKRVLTFTHKYNYALKLRVIQTDHGSFFVIANQITVMSFSCLSKGPTPKCSTIQSPALDPNDLAKNVDLSNLGFFSVRLHKTANFVLYI